MIDLKQYNTHHIIHVKFIQILKVPTYIDITLLLQMSLTSIRLKQYNMNLNWQRQQQSIPYSGQQKQGYTLNFIPHLHSLLLYGGNLIRNNDIYLYNIPKKQWKLQKVSTPKPIARKFHTAYYEKQIKGLITYGGQAEKKRSLDCFYVLFVDEWKWRKLLFKVSVPPARQFHTFTSMGNGNYLIYGGITNPYGTYLQDIWILKGMDKLKDTKTMQMGGCSCSQIVGKGQPPPARYAHNAYYHNQILYIIGGQSAVDQQNFMIFSLSLRTLYWSKHLFNINLSQLMGVSILPSPQDQNQILVLGGIDCSSSEKAIKYNKYIYTINLSDQAPRIHKNQKIPEYLNSPIYINTCCALPYNQFFGMVCTSAENKLILYRIQDQGQSQLEEELELEEYLRYIKNEQFLSQELIEKVNNLESLYKQIQTFSAKLYHQYQQIGQYDEQIQKQRKIQIEACKIVKEQYIQIDDIYNKNIVDLKRTRKQLAQISQYFEGCMETQRDEEV